MPSPSAPRKVAFSAKQKRAQLLEKRAIKRGDLPAPEVDSKKARGRGRLAKSTDTDAAIRTRMLISSFLKPSAEFLEASKNAAATEPLVRPIPESSKVLGLESLDQELTCPRRPKWRYGMSKKEVERNEEGLFTKWIAQTDETIDTWRESNAVLVSNADSESRILPAPTYYERNLEVWRQLWRVCELSSILMLLLDARCPPLHYPPSLDAYIKSLRPARQVILVLTKIDMVGEERASAWKSWLKEKYGDTGAGVQVVGTQSYQQTSYGEGQGSRVKYQPHLPTNLLEELRVALKTAHTALVEPPAKVKEDPEKLANWKPAVRAHIDWDAIGHRGDKGAATTVEAPMAEEPEPEDENKPTEATEGEEEDVPSKEYLENRYLTVGLIGQPNVGKSSLLNAIFGEHKVKTSRTPGKTKHFQTLFLTPEIRLVDCPGLVFPALVPMELQVLSNILPIAQIPALPACIHYAGNLMPIESIFGVDMSMLEEEAPVEDKRTWREGMRPAKPAPPPKEQRWTAVQVMNAYATKRGWKTAHTGWPDSMRGGNAMMRSIVEGRVPWAYWPPGSNPPIDDLGIWVKGQHERHDEYDYRADEDNRGGTESEGDTLSAHELLSEDEEAGEDEGDPIENKSAAKATIGRFAALGVAGESEEEEDNGY